MRLRASSCVLGMAKLREGVSMKRIDGEHYEEQGKVYEVVKSIERVPDNAMSSGFKTCCLCAFGDSDKFPAGCTGSREVNQVCVELNNSASRMRDYKYFVEERTK